MTVQGMSLRVSLALVHLLTGSGSCVVQDQWCVGGKGVSGSPGLMGTMSVTEP